MKSRLPRILRQLAHKLSLSHVPLPQAPESMMSKIARFVVCEMVEGEYVEFGVFDGGSFAVAYHAFERQTESRIALSAGGEHEEATREERRKLWQKMRFVAVDSFQGLPALTVEDTASRDFEQAMFACSAERFQDNVRQAGVPPEKLVTIRGWFHDVERLDLLAQNGVRKAAVIWIDCDLYSSAKAALACATDLVQDGTIIVCDDWFSYRGSPHRGEQRAFMEWQKAPPISSRFSFQEYQRDSWKRISFIASSNSAET